MTTLTQQKEFCKHNLNSDERQKIGKNKANVSEHSSSLGVGGLNPGHYYVHTQVSSIDNYKSLVKKPTNSNARNKGRSSDNIFEKEQNPAKQRQDTRKKYLRKKKHDRIAPAKERLKGFLLNRLKGEATWTKLNFKQFSILTGISDRQIRRIKNELEANDPDLVFRTVTKDTGKGWVVLVAKREDLKFDHEPLFYKENGDSRHLRPNMLSSEVEQPTDIPMLIEGSKDQQKNINSRNCEKLEQLKKNTQQTESDTTAKPNIDFSNQSKTTNEGGNGKMEGENKQPSSSKQKKLAHIIKHVLEDEHWENCKVKYSPGHAYNYAIKALTQGYDTKAIIGAYDYAVHVRHGDATDIGLNTGNKYYQFEASSTISLALDRLEKTKGKCVKQDAMLFTKKAKREHEAQKKEFEESNRTVFEQKSESDCLRKAGFRENDIKIFERFQKNELRGEHIRIKAKLLANMARTIGV